MTWQPAIAIIKTEETKWHLSIQSHRDQKESDLTVPIRIAYKESIIYDNFYWLRETQFHPKSQQTHKNNNVFLNISDPQKGKKNMCTLQWWIWNALVKILMDYAHIFHQVGLKWDNIVNNVTSQMSKEMFLFSAVEVRGRDSFPLNTVFS